MRFAISRERLWPLTCGAFGLAAGMWWAHYATSLTHQHSLQLLLPWPTAELSMLTDLLIAWVALYIIQNTNSRAKVAAMSLFFASAMVSAHYVWMGSPVVTSSVLATESLVAMFAVTLFMVVWRLVVERRRVSQGCGRAAQTQEDALPLRTHSPIERWNEFTNADIDTERSVRAIVQMTARLLNTQLDATQRKYVELIRHHGEVVGSRVADSRRRNGRPHYRMHILLVDRNTTSQKDNTRQLENLGHLVSVATNARDAVNSWQRTGFDLILMSCERGDQDAIGATRKIRRLERATSRIPIVALSTHATSADQQQWNSAGLDEVLTGPIGHDELSECLSRLLRNHKQSVRNAAADPPGLGQLAASPGEPNQLIKVADENAGQADATAKPTNRTGVRGAPVAWPALIDSAHGDEEFARMLAGVYIASCTQSLALIVSSHGEGNYEVIQAAAMTLGKTSDKVCAAATKALAEKCEKLASLRDGSGMTIAIEELSVEVQRTIEYLQAQIG